MKLFRNKNKGFGFEKEPEEYEEYYWYSKYEYFSWQRHKYGIIFTSAAIILYSIYLLAILIF